MTWVKPHNLRMFFFGKEASDFDKLAKNKAFENGGIIEYLKGLTSRVKKAIATNVVAETTELNIYKRFLEDTQWDIQACSRSQPDAKVPTELAVLTLLQGLQQDCKADDRKARSDLENFSKEALIDVLMSDHRAVVEAIRAKIPSTPTDAINTASIENSPQSEIRAHADAVDALRSFIPDITNQAYCTPINVAPRLQGGIHAHHLDTIRDYVTPELAAKNQKIVDANPSKNKSKKQPRKRDQFRKDNKVRNPFYTSSSACVVCLFTKQDANGKPLKTYTFSYCRECMPQPHWPKTTRATGYQRALHPRLCSEACFEYFHTNRIPGLDFPNDKSAKLRRKNTTVKRKRQKKEPTENKRRAAAEKDVRSSTVDIDANPGISI